MSDFDKFWWVGAVTTFALLQRDRRDWESIGDFMLNFVGTALLCVAAWPWFLGRNIRKSD